MSCSFPINFSFLLVWVALLGKLEVCLLDSSLIAILTQAEDTVRIVCLFHEYYGYVWCEILWGERETIWPRQETTLTGPIQIERANNYQECVPPKTRLHLRKHFRRIIRLGESLMSTVS